MFKSFFSSETLFNIFFKIDNLKNWFKILDPDPNFPYLDPQHWRSLGGDCFLSICDDPEVWWGQSCGNAAHLVVPATWIAIITNAAQCASGCTCHVNCMLTKLQLGFSVKLVPIAEFKILSEDSFYIIEIRNTKLTILI